MIKQNGHNFALNLTSYILILYVLKQEGKKKPYLTSEHHFVQGVITGPAFSLLGPFSLLQEK